MDDVIMSPLQEAQQWLRRSSHFRIDDECVGQPKSAKLFRDGCGPFAISEVKKYTSRTSRIAHKKTAQNWVVAEGAFVHNLTIPLAIVDTDQLEVTFLGHAAKWERDTRYVSSMTDIVSHPSYKKIIAMGRAKPKEMLSFLLRDMRENERPWFTALAHPVKPTDAGRVDRMTNAWIGWGMKEGLL
jgi:hypothetical protein